MMKRIVSVLSAFSLTLGLCSTAVPGSVASADDEIVSVAVGTVTAKAGETVSVPVMLEQNTGIAAMRLAVTYDASKLKLTAAENGSALAEAEFLAGDDTAANPYYLVWDDLGAENMIGTGEIASLQFEVLADVTGSAEVAVAVDEVIDKNLKNVPFTEENGAVLIAAGSLRAEAPEELIPYATRFSVPVYLDENPGVTAFRLSLEYDNELIQLENSPESELFPGAEFLPADHPKNQPLCFVWDDINVHTETGLLFTLEFSVINNRPGNTVLSFRVDAADDTPEMVGISGCDVTVRIGEGAATAVTTTTTSKTTTSKTTTSKTTTSKTTTSKTTTSKTTTSKTTTSKTTTSKTTTSKTTTSKTTTSKTTTSKTTTSKTTTTVTSTTGVTIPSEPIDLNDDGKKNVADVVCFVIFVTEGRYTEEDKEPEEEPLLTCDFDGDGVLTIIDVVLLLRAIISL